MLRGSAPEGSTSCFPQIMPALSRPRNTQLTVQQLDCTYTAPSGAVTQESIGVQGCTAQQKARAKPSLQTGPNTTFPCSPSLKSQVYNHVNLSSWPNQFIQGH